MALRFALPFRFMLLLLAAFSFASYGQIQPSVQDQSSVRPRTRAIEGTVLDKAGAPVPGAVVLLKDLKTLQVRSFIAQRDGKYHFYGLSPDINYQVRAQSNDVVSPIKNISVFDSHTRIVVNLKLKKMKKS